MLHVRVFLLGLLVGHCALAATTALPGPAMPTATPVPLMTMEPLVIPSDIPMIEPAATEAPVEEPTEAPTAMPTPVASASPTAVPTLPPQEAFQEVSDALIGKPQTYGPWPSDSSAEYLITSGVGSQSTPDPTPAPTPAPVASPTAGTEIMATAPPPAPVAVSPLLADNDPDLDLMNRLAAAARGAFTSPNRRGITPATFVGDVIFGLRRRAGTFTAIGTSAADIYRVGWEAASTPFGQPRANCGELAAFIHAFIIWDRLFNNSRALGNTVVRWRIILRGDMDHAQVVVETTGGGRYLVDAWAGTATAVTTDANLIPTGFRVAGSTSIFFFNP